MAASQPARGGSSAKKSLYANGKLKERPAAKKSLYNAKGQLKDRPKKKGR